MKFLKIFAGLLILLFLIFGVGLFWGKSWINNNLESVVNADPDRKYNFNFDKLEISLLSQAILIQEVTITPMGQQLGVFVEGKVSEVLLGQVDILKLLFSKSLEIQNLSFLEPDFVIHIPKENKENKPGNALQGLFGDILSRGIIRNFELKSASALMQIGTDQIGSLSNLNILASELSTDSLKLNYPIPFDFDRILIGIDSISYLMGNGQKFKVGKIDFDSRSQNLKMEAISLLFPGSLREAAMDMEFQVDLIEFSLDSLVLSGIEANSNLYSDLDVRAKKLELTGLFLEDYRDKKLPRPQEEIKPLFQGLVSQVHIPLKLDSLQVINGTIVYGESVPKTNEFWQFHLDNLNGQFINLTTISEYQSAFGQLDGNFTAKIQGEGELTIGLKVPYSRDEFDMELDFRAFPLPRLNTILKPIMNGEVVSGDLRRLHILIHADSVRAVNQFRFDYSDLKIGLFQKDSQKKNKLLSTIANIALHTSNLPGDRKYSTAEYSTARNRYRGPFHLIWNSTKDGIMTIVPGGVAKEILNSSSN